VLPAFQPQWTVRRGVEELLDAFQRYGLTYEEFMGPRLGRLKHIKQLIGERRIDIDLRWQHVSPHATAEEVAGA